MKQEKLRFELREVLEARRVLEDASRPEAVKKQHERGKLTARERLDLLLDPDGRVEYGSMVTSPDGGALAMTSASDVTKAKYLLIEGPIVCTGFIEGRPVAVAADDFTVLGGSVHALGGQKLRRIADLALRRGMPLIFLIDGGGHRIHNLDTRMFAAGGSHAPFREMAQMSGWAPMVAAVMGPAYAGPAMFTAMADFVPVVKGTGWLGMASPKLVKAGTGEEISHEELAGSAVQARAGAIDLECEDDADCIMMIKKFLSYLPSNAVAPLPLKESDDPSDRLCAELRDVISDERRRAYDVKKVVNVLCDEGTFFELRPGFAKNLVTGFGRLAGLPVGIMANQPLIFAGTLDAAACSKAAHFLSTCDAFGLPVVSLIDTPGLLVGSKAESENTVRQVGRLLLAWGHMSVPIVSIVTRKAYGGGYVAMGGGRSINSEAAFIWPTAEVCAMGVEGAVDIAFHHDYESAANPAARRQELIEELFGQVTPFRAASGFGVDEILDPVETRARLINVFRMNSGRRLIYMPPKVHAIDPL
jgi:propionyl-CoA carboxylase beta chain